MGNLPAAGPENSSRAPWGRLFCAGRGTGKNTRSRWGVETGSLACLGGGFVVGRRLESRWGVANPISNDAGSPRAADGAVSCSGFNLPIGRL
jgi:hypothetical protein